MLISKGVKRNGVWVERKDLYSTPEFQEIYIEFMKVYRRAPKFKEMKYLIERY